MHVIQNFDALAVTDLRRDALAIAEAGYAAVDVRRAVEKKMSVEAGQLHIAEKSYPIAGRNVYFVGIGKCALRGGRAIEKLLGDALTAGIVLDVADDGESSVPKMETLIGTHPLPSEANVRASERILAFLSGRSVDDLVIMLISGGGSTLLSLPEAPSTVEDESALFEKLSSQGAPIQDLNIVRKHLSLARGGALAKAAYPSEVASLIVSDVPGDDLSSIASGPTVLDTSSIADAQAILKKYSIAETQITFLETTKDKKYFKRVSNTLFLSSQDALEAMSAEAGARGYAARVVDLQFTGEARDVAHTINLHLHDAGPKTALLYAGESTVTLGANPGRGGRTQEMALAALGDIRSDEVILPFASDGHDNTDHAGAIADELTRAHTTEKNVAPEAYLDIHNSYDFFEATGDALMTSPTGANVSDLVVALKG